MPNVTGSPRHRQGTLHGAPAEGMRLRRHCAEPRVMVGNLGRKARLRRRQSLLSPVYSLGRSRGSLGRSRTMLRKAPKRSGVPVARVSSPTGMYTEHIAWARTLASQSSQVKDSLRTESSTVQILAHADFR